MDWRVVPIEHRPGESTKYRIAARRTHPDAGGDHDTFAAVSQAAQTLGVR